VNKVRTTSSSIDDYYERDTTGTGWTQKEMLEVVAHELILIRFALEKIAGED